MPKYAANDDTNQAALVEALRFVGMSVEHAHTIGRGFPDLVVGIDGVTLLVEVKYNAGKLRPNQREFFNEWRGAALVARVPGDVLRWDGWKQPFTPEQIENAESVYYIALDD